MSRLFVDRKRINEEAMIRLVSSLQEIGAKLTPHDMHDLIMEAGFLPDYRDYGTDMASIRVAIKRSRIKQQTALLKMFTQN